MYRFLYALLFIPLFASAQTFNSSNSVNAQIKVTINPYASCTSYLSSARSGIDNNSLSFGEVRPDQIQNAPSPSGLTEEVLMNTSNINGLYGPGLRTPTHTLNFICDRNPNLNSITGAFEVNILHGRPVVAESGLELIKHTDFWQDWNEIAVLLYMKDRYSTSPLKVNRPMRYGFANDPVLLPDSFRLINNQYVANLDIYIGLYWINTSNRSFTPQELTFPMTFRVWYK